MTYRRKLIEVALPLKAINEASAREKSIRHGHPSTLHLWWARRPLAAARAVLFAQLVDDPSAWPELYPTEDAQEKERQRLFGIIERLVPWEASNDEQVLNEARLEIARSWARSHSSPTATKVLGDGVKPEDVNEYLAMEVPPVHDPFAGGGTIPLEAQRLGLRAIATDLNPVAVLINKALIEIPPKFAGMPPVNPESRRKAGLRTWKGAQGLAEDVRYYGAWMRDEAKKRIGHLYPDAEITAEIARDRPDLKGLEGHKLTVIAWLWVRTVASPDPAVRGAHVPLVSSYWLSRRGGREAWLELLVSKSRRSYDFLVRTGPPPDLAKIADGLKIGRGDFRCVLTGTPISAQYIRENGRAGRLGVRLMAVVCEGPGGRVFLAPDSRQGLAASIETDESIGPQTTLPEEALGFRVQNYGIARHRQLFTSRQLIALSTHCALLDGASQLVEDDASAVGNGDGRSLADGGCGTRAYGDAIATYLALAVSKAADLSSAFCFWQPNPEHLKLAPTFSRHALAMTWDFAEGNPFSESSGNYYRQVDLLADGLDRILGNVPAAANQQDAATLLARDEVYSTDPPYYDNVPYADLSDFFYVWLRLALRERWPTLLSTVLVPKTAELVADPFRHGGRHEADMFFLDGMSQALRAIAAAQTREVPATVYYAFKESESSSGDNSGTGWSTFIQATLAAGFAIVGTWPVRTERPGRFRETGSNALASSIVLVLRGKNVDATTITRGDFRRELRSDLPAALKALQHGNIAPVDVAQASIGPGMAIFSRHAKVLEADGSAMTVRSALQLINEALDEYLSAQEGEADPDTRFAITWFEANAWAPGSYGDAETLAKARNVSVAGIAEAGVVHSAAGKVRLLKRSELPGDWDPSTDDRLTVWEATQHLIKRLDEQGESAAASLLKTLGPVAEHARDLAYRLYSTCERKGWAEDARAYNGLVIAWPELEKLAAQAPPADTRTGQLGLGLGAVDEVPAAKKKGAKRAKKGGS